MNFQKIWKNIINRYSYNFLALIGLEFIITFLILATMFCVYTILTKLLPTSILNTPLISMEGISNISELIKALFAMFILSSPTLSVISSFLSFLILGIIFLFKRIKKFQIKNPFKLLLIIYIINLLIIYILGICIIPTKSLLYGGADVLFFGQLYYCHFVTIAILTIYTVLILLEFIDNFRIDRNYFKETKYYEFTTLFGFLTVIAFIVITISTAYQLIH